MFPFAVPALRPWVRPASWLAACFAAGVFSQSATGQIPSQAAAGFPSKPIRIVIPSPAGGPTDILGRLLAQGFQAKWGQPAVPDNRPGASQFIASELVAKAAPDGYTLLLGTHQSHQNNAGLFRKLPYDPIKDFVPISLLASAPLVLLVHPSVPAKSLHELLAIARAKPGSLNYGSQGYGSGGHIGTAMVEQMADVRMSHIPYKGAAPASVDLVGGRIDVLMASITSNLGNIRTGKVRALGVTSLQRSPLLPDVPSISELGLSGFEVVGWFGLFAPALTPRDIVLALNTEVVRIMNEPDTKNLLTNQGLIVVANSPEQFAQYVAREIDKWTKFIRGAKIEAD
ncbi:MAG: tripartite tricarboxylate transporter substrate binding protein [Betaproteobacteria bacterium]|nr:tripartite tricarboxylate transporter substrate binding protein [Betaproteobacteria bacterium]